MQARKKTRKILIEFHLAPLNCYSSPSTVWNKSSLQTFYCSSIGGLTKILFYFISYIDGVSIYLVTRLLLLLIGSHNRGKNVFFFGMTLFDRSSKYIQTHRLLIDIYYIARKCQRMKSILISRRNVPHKMFRSDQVRIFGQKVYA